MFFSPSFTLKCPHMTNLNSPNCLNMKNAYTHIYKHYVTDASFLWMLRSQAIIQPHYCANDILALEQRIEVRLDGVMDSVDLGWEACEEALELQAPGEIFTAMVTAMRSHESHKIQMAVGAGLENKYALPGLISAMGWLPAGIANPWIERFLNGKDMDHKYLGLAACSVRRQDPGQSLLTILQRDDCQQHEKLYARALRLVGELRRQDCMPAIHAAMKADNSEPGFWANWSAVLLGHRASVHNLQPFVFNTGPCQHNAIQLAFRVLPIKQAQEWVSRLSSDDNQTRTVIKATGVLGDPHAVNWLISKMRDPTLARLAGESFTSITGVGLEEYNLLSDETGYSPDIFDDETDSIALGEDEKLLLPDAEKVAAIWRNYGQHFITGHRYFMGQPVTADILHETLSKGTQRQRHAAALELALHEQGVPLPNASARILI